MALVTDRAVVDLATYAPEQIGRTRRRTPEGFLLCEGVRIARTGPMLYTQAEMPDVEPGPLTSMITVIRDAEVLFDPDTILSYSGKPVTNDHPPCPVTPANCKTYDVGTVLNPRRGEGAESEYLIADLLITDAATIEEIEAAHDPARASSITGKREISAGYDAEYEQVKPGVARQTKNVGNHVALVKRARGGPALSIQDQQPEEPSMATRASRRLLDGIRKAFKAKDEAALEEALGKTEDMLDEEPGEEGKTIVIKVEGAGAAPAAEPKVDDAPADPYEERFSKIEDSLGKLADAIEGLKPKAEEPKPEPVADEEAAEEEKEADKAQVQDAMSKAEILSPGIKLPTQDSASAVKRSVVTDLRRRALTAAFADSARKVHVEAVMGGQSADFGKMRPSQVAVIFDAAAAVARAAHNAGASARHHTIPQGPMTAAKLQERINERRKRS